jgi:hypothetical protein
LVFTLIEFDHGIGGRSTYKGPAKHDFGYLQSISLKDENHLWATRLVTAENTADSKPVDSGTMGGG